MSERIEVFKLKHIGLKEGANLERGIGHNEFEVRADRYTVPFNNFCGRLLVTTKKPREIIHSSPQGFVERRTPYDF